MFTLHPQLAQDCYYLADLELSALLLARDANYPWCILVPREQGVEEIYQLKEVGRVAMLAESCALSRCLQKEFNADKLNVAALGNVVPQLHIHHIVRYKNDPAWPAPVWGKLPAIEYDEALLDKTIAKIKAGLKNVPAQWKISAV